MGKKKHGAKKRQASEATASSASTTPAAAAAAAPPPASSSTTQNGNATADRPSAPRVRQQTSEASLPPVTPSPAPVEEAEDISKRAEKTKEQGNAAFKAAKYAEAIELYSKAIELNPLEPSYLTNRAASYMAQKRFRSALEDCQIASSLQSSSPSPKTLLRLAKCQLATGSSTPALSTIRSILAIEPKNSQALLLMDKVQQLQGHVQNFEQAKKKKDWPLARLALDKCLQAIEGEGGDVPPEWRFWRVELELSRGNWDAANIAANDALRLNANSPDALTLRGLVLFLSGRLPQALQHLTSALRFDPGHEPAQKLRRRIKEVEKLKEEGNVAFKAGKLQDAVDKYTECLERIGEAEEEGKGGQIRATLLSNRATTLLKLDRHADALTDTNASLRLYPNSFKALRTRARIHLHLEDYDASIADFKAAIQEAGSSGSSSAEGGGDFKSLKAELKKAEAALKRSKTKDYYKILGVARDCTEMDIKKAYRRESLKHHPDKGGDEENFKLVVEANAVLSDPDRRERYDLGEDEDGLNDGGGMGGGGPFGMSQADLEELFASFGPRFAGGFSGGPGFGPGPSGGGGGGGRRQTHTHSHSHGYGF